MSNKSSHIVDVMYRIIRVCIVVGILATVTGHYIDVSQRDTIVIQGIPEHSGTAEVSEALLTVQDNSADLQPEYTAATENTVRSAEPVEAAVINPEEVSAPEAAAATADTTTIANTTKPSEINISELKNDIIEAQSEADSDPEKAGLININTAPARVLMELDGIGEVKAQAIVQYRREHGNFISVDDLINVKGIGEKTLEKNRDKITV